MKSFKSHAERVEFYTNFDHDIAGQHIHNVFLLAGYLMHYCSLLEVIVNSMLYDLATRQNQPLSDSVYEIPLKKRVTRVCRLISEIPPEADDKESLMAKKGRLEDFNGYDKGREWRNVIAHKPVIMATAGAHTQPSYYNVQYMRGEIFIKHTPWDWGVPYGEQWLQRANEWLAELLFDLEYENYLHRAAKNLNPIMTIAP